MPAVFLVAVSGYDECLVEDKDAVRCLLHQIRLVNGCLIARRPHPEPNARSPHAL